MRWGGPPRAYGATNEAESPPCASAVPVAIVQPTSVNPDPLTRLPSIVCHTTSTGAPGAKPWPLTVTAVPGGPSAGETERLGPAARAGTGTAPGAEGGARAAAGAGRAAPPLGAGGSGGGGVVVGARMENRVEYAMPVFGVTGAASLADTTAWRSDRIGSVDRTWYVADQFCVAGSRPRVRVVSGNWNCPEGAL